MTRNEQVARHRAETFRAEHGLGARPLGDLFELVHTALGCDVLAIDADEVEHGLSMLDPKTGRIAIAVATSTHPMRQRSSIAHEVGHVVAGDLLARTPPAPGTRGPAEIQADAFARHLLLPVSALRARYGAPSRSGAAGVGEADLAAVVQEFEVSPSLATIQFREADLIRPRMREAWAPLTTASLAVRYGWLSQYRALSAGSSRSRAPQALMRRAVEGYHRGMIDIIELASWHELPPEQLLEALGPPRNRSTPDGGLPTDFDDFDEDAPLFPAETRAAPPPAS